MLLRTGASRPGPFSCSVICSYRILSERDATTVAIARRLLSLLIKYHFAVILRAMQAINASSFRMTPHEPTVLRSEWGAKHASIFTIADLRTAAKRRLPKPIFDFLDGAADDERSLRANERCFETWDLVPRMLAGAAAPELATTILGERVSMPVLVGATGMSRLFHPAGELAAARAAAKAGVTYCLSTMGSETIEEIGAATTGPKCFQIYAFRDRGLTREFIDRARAAGFSSLCLTVDVPVPGNRERDLRNGMTLPPKLGLMGMLDIVRHPRWALGYAVGRPLTIANVAHRVEEATSNVSTLSAYIANQFDPTIGWDDVRWMIEAWNGPFAVKGLLHPEDARMAAEIGASAVIVSNHGGRQLDTAPATVAALPAIVDAVGDSIEVLIDGGIRRGTDVAKALALGARACLVGRPYLYGLAAGGEAGVTRALEILATELRRTLALLGAASVDALCLEHVRRSPFFRTEEEHQC